MRRNIIRVIFLFTFLFAGLAAAGEERGFSILSFQNAPGYGSYLTLEGAEVPPGLSFGLGAMVGYQYRPLVIRGCNKMEDGKCADWADDETALVEHHLALEVLGRSLFTASSRRAWRSRPCST